jgi:hypothetical protein
MSHPHVIVGEQIAMREAQMIKALLTMMKALWIALRHPPDQDFINELYVREQAQRYRYLYGVGPGAKDVPPGRYFR